MTEEWYTHGGAEKRAHTWVSRDGQHGECWIVDDDGTWSNWNGKPPMDGQGVEVMSRIGKKRSGRVLDGRTWDEMPELKHAVYPGRGEKNRRMEAFS